jgi:PAS domain S-box-containing protein
MPEKKPYAELEKKIRKLKEKVRRQSLVEKILQSKEAAYLSLLKVASDLLWEVDNQWVLRSISPSVKKLWGYKPEEVINKRIFDFMVPEDCLKMLMQFREIAGSLQAFHGSKSRFFHKDGRRVVLEISGAPLIDQRGRLTGYQGIIRDITEHGNVEKIRSVFDEISRAVNSDIGLNQLFKKIHESLSRLIDTTNFFIAIYDAELHQIRFTYYTDKGDDIEVIDADDPGSVTAEVIRTKKPIFLNETQSQQKYASENRPIGKIAKVWLGVPLKIKGKLIGAVAVQSYTDPNCYTLEDIRLLEAVTEHIAIAIDRKQAEEALKESEEKYRDLVENINDVIFTTDAKGVFTYISPAVQAVLEYTPKEILGRSLDRLVPPEDVKMVRDDFKRLLSGWNDVREYRLLTKSGAIRWVRTSGRPILKGGRFIGLRAVFADITEAKQLQAQLQHAQRMEAIGTLAGGLAHDFNNILTGIQGRASLMLLDTYPDHLSYEHLHCIEEYVKNAASLTRQLLGFAKGGLYEIKPVDLNPVIAKIIHLFGRTHKEIKIQRQFEKELWIVEADQSQIEQVLLNLFVNARQAMQEVGQITLTTANETLDEAFLKPYGFAPGRYVKITVTDTGPGIPREIQSKIFDPFFTTKEMGRGTGLGLASAYGIIKNHNGIIKVASEAGVGAEFRIYLPASEKKTGPEPLPIQGFYKGRETILLVEDEHEVMEVSAILLEKLGYRVFRAESGIKAIEIFRERWEQIDLVILDIIMPEMAGTETFLRLRKLNPNVKVLLASGYSAGAWNEQETPIDYNGFIQKPFRIQELSRKIREILNF